MSEPKAREGDLGNVEGRKKKTCTKKKKRKFDVGVSLGFCFFFGRVIVPCWEDGYKYGMVCKKEV